MKKIYAGIGSVLLLAGVAMLAGCGNESKSLPNDEKPSTQSSSASEETFTNETISITLNTNKYSVEIDKDFYKPSLRIVKSKEEYISVQKLKNGNEKITWTEDGNYTEEKLETEFRDYISELTGFTGIEKEVIGDKTLYKTETSVNAIKSNIYRILTPNNNVYKIVVSGPNFKDTEESKTLLTNLKLQ